MGGGEGEGVLGNALHTQVFPGVSLAYLTGLHRTALAASLKGGSLKTQKSKRYQEWFASIISGEVELTV